MDANSDMDARVYRLRVRQSRPRISLRTQASKTCVLLQGKHVQRRKNANSARLMVEGLDEGGHEQRMKHCDQRAVRIFPSLHVLTL